MSIVTEKRAELAQITRQYSLDQVDYWKQVPWLALQADGRSGYSDAYARAYGNGYWAVASSGSYYTVYVDLDTGELVSAQHVENLASDASVLSIPDGALDAAELVEELKEGAKTPTWKGYDEKAVEEWRQKIIAQKNLTSVYSRGGPRKNLPFVWD